MCTDLATKGAKDVFIVYCDGLKGPLEVEEVAWSSSMVQISIPRVIRAANRRVSYTNHE